jgi:hypothetical protein
MAEGGLAGGNGCLPTANGVCANARERFASGKGDLPPARGCW